MPTKPVTLQDLIESKSSRNGRDEILPKKENLVQAKLRMNRAGETFAVPRERQLASFVECKSSILDVTKLNQARK